ncbi:MAG: hypothetical protein QW666_02445 [Candidatus Woesearchaeota archaeon]
MEFENIIQKLESMKEFKEWKDKHKHYYLAHAFVMLDEPNKGIWQIGYYDNKTNKVATAILEGEKVSFVPDQEILQATQQITELKPEDVKLTVEKALEVANACIKENYPKELLLKSFFIIQHLPEGTVFNITFLTQSFSTINIKISTIDGKILKHSMERLANFS